MTGILTSCSRCGTGSTCQRWYTVISHCRHTYTPALLCCRCRANIQRSKFDRKGIGLRPNTTSILTWRPFFLFHPTEKQPLHFLYCPLEGVCFCPLLCFIGYFKENIKIHTGSLPLISVPYPLSFPLLSFLCFPFPLHPPLPLEVGLFYSS